MLEHAREYQKHNAILLEMNVDVPSKLEKKTFCFHSNQHY